MANAELEERLTILVPLDVNKFLKIGNVFIKAVRQLSLERLII